VGQKCAVQRMNGTYATHGTYGNSHISSMCPISPTRSLEDAFPTLITPLLAPD